MSQLRNRSVIQTASTELWNDDDVLFEAMVNGPNGDARVRHNHRLRIWNSVPPRMKEIPEFQIWAMKRDARSAIEWHDGWSTMVQLSSWLANQDLIRSRLMAFLLVVLLLFAVQGHIAFYAAAWWPVLDLGTNNYLGKMLFDCVLCAQVRKRVRTWPQ